jgi:hypothetical protein
MKPTAYEFLLTTGNVHLPAYEGRKFTVCTPVVLSVPLTNLTFFNFKFIAFSVEISLVTRKCAVTFHFTLFECI